MGLGRQTTQWHIAGPLQGLSEETFNREVSNKGTLKPCIYDDGYDSGQVSLLWGENEGFRRRVSEAVNSMPSTLLKSVPSTFDGFSGTGLCLAMGTLGRNKGKVPGELEATSAWYPRPNKVMR